MERIMVPVERYVAQVTDGVHYKGHIRITEIQFDYELVFGIPIEQIDDFEPTSPEEVRQTIQITVTRSNEPIELTNEEYAFFFHMVVEFALDFYNHPQTRSSQGILGSVLNGLEARSILDASVSVGITSSGLFDFPSDTCEMLSTAKFGCVLTTA